MIILTYIGVLMLCYGIYNMLSYYSMLPTLKSSKNMNEQGRENEGNIRNPLIIRFAEKFAEKWDLEWNGSERINEILQYNGIYYSAAVYSISLILRGLCGLFLCLPLVFWDIKWFVALSIGHIIIVVLDPALLYIRYQKSMALDRPVDSAKRNRKQFTQTCIRLLPGVFFLCQLLLFIAMLT